MEDEKKVSMPKKEIIWGGIGLILGIAITCLVGFGMDYFAKSIGIAKLKYGDEALATVDGKSITAQAIYDKAKKTDGLNLLMGQIDESILSNMYELTETEDKKAKEQADYYIEYYTGMGYTEEEFLTGNGFANYEEFLADIKTKEKSNKYLYDFLEKKLEAGAVQKYYDENKTNVETYDSEHILVKISEEVPDEQALALANEILVKVNDGKTFAEIKEEYGDRVTHEELGFQGKTSSLEQAYIDELVALEDGKCSQTPIKTSYGYHIIHRISTATFEDLRPTIIETLSADLLSADQNITYKAFIELRKEKNLTIFDEELKKQYENYCNQVYTPVAES